MKEIKTVPVFFETQCILLCIIVLYSYPALRCKCVLINLVQFSSVIVSPPGNDSFQSGLMFYCRGFI